MLLSYRLQRLLTSSKEYTSQVHTANKLFLSKEQTVQDCVKDYFDHEIEKLDFSGNGLLHSVDVINDWVSNVTQNNIQNLISAESLSPSTQLILVSSLFFLKFFCLDVIILYTVCEYILSLYSKAN